MISEAWIIATKEIKLLFKSTRRIFLLFTTPLIFILIFVLFIAILAPLAAVIDEPLELIVIQDDDGINGLNWGEEFYKLLKSNNLTKDYVYINKSEENLNGLLLSKNFSVLLYIPANFSNAINQSFSAQYYLYYDNIDVKAQTIVSNILNISQLFNQVIIFFYAGPINLNRVFVLPEGLSGSSGLESIASSFITLIPLYAIIFLVIPSLSLVLISVTIEREQKTLETLILQPIGRKSIIAGKLFYGAVLVVFNAIITLITLIGLTILGIILLPSSIKSEVLPLLVTIASEADVSVWIFIFYVLLGLVIVSLLVITAAVVFSLMAKDEREANMVISALVIIPLVSTLIIAFLPLEIIDSSLQIILVILPLLGYLFAIYLSLNLGEITLLTWFSLVAQLAWVLIGIWFAGRLIESEGILEISYKRLLSFRRK
ncbi:ABC transporter permease [Candidatus Hodarchaeum mangrovi]